MSDERRDEIVHSIWNDHEFIPRDPWVPVEVREAKATDAMVEYAADWILRLESEADEAEEQSIQYARKCLAAFDRIAELERENAELREWRRKAEVEMDNVRAEVGYKNYIKERLAGNERLRVAFETFGVGPSVPANDPARVIYETLRDAIEGKAP